MTETEFELRSSVMVALPLISELQEKSRHNRLEYFKRVLDFIQIISFQEDQNFFDYQKKLQLIDNEYNEFSPAYFVKWNYDSVSVQIENVFGVVSFRLIFSSDSYTLLNVEPILDENFGTIGVVSNTSDNIQKLCNLQNGFKILMDEIKRDIDAIEHNILNSSIAKIFNDPNDYIKVHKFLWEVGLIYRYPISRYWVASGKKKDMPDNAAIFGLPKYYSFIISELKTRGYFKVNKNDDQIAEAWYKEFSNRPINPRTVRNKKRTSHPKWYETFDRKFPPKDS